MIGTPGTKVVYINEAFEADEPITPEHFDLLLADGWRHFGRNFTRYNLSYYRDEIRRVLPLRIRLADFEPSKSKRRILKRNADLETSISPVSLTGEMFDLFDRHKRRFEDNVPESLFDFISRTAGVPTELNQVTAYYQGRLLAVSFFDCGKTSVSAIYGFFDPEEKSRSLGIFTMLKVIEWATFHSKTFYYPGYAYEGESFYDYKKRFSALERFTWNGHWVEMDEP